MEVVIWRDLFRDQKLCFHCDNLGVVTDINQLSSSLPPWSLALGTWSAYSQDWQLWKEWCKVKSVGAEEADMVLLL